MFSKLHRFTPPTCTLEIKINQSPWNFWWQHNISQPWHFKLSFDDPRVPHSQQVTITGDRQDLEQLNLAVNNYLQHFLANSLVMPVSSNSQALDSPQANFQPRDKPYLKPKGLVNHELFWVSLGNETQKQQLTLSTVQLFDLATALESYRSHMAEEERTQQTAQAKIIPLTGAIAAVALVGVGITALWLKSLPHADVVSRSASESGSQIPQFDEIVPPTELETPKAKPQPQVDESISSRQKLPPPPAVDAPKPKPNIPDPADYPLAQVGRQSGLKPSATQNQAEAPSSDRSAPEESTITLMPSVETTPDSQNYSVEITKTPAKVQSDVAFNKPASSPSQLQQVTDYFQSRWQPPEDLKQSLEYRIYLNPDGTIKRVVPMGKAAQLYLSQTPIPVRGEKFIAPGEKTDSGTIRLLLNPNGRVQTFKE